jgi:hypothetical protein
VRFQERRSGSVLEAMVRLEAISLWPDITRNGILARTLLVPRIASPDTANCS